MNVGNTIRSHRWFSLDKISSEKIDIKKSKRALSVCVNEKKSEKIKQTGEITSFVYLFHLEMNEIR